MIPELKWESNSEYSRAKVFGGWLVKFAEDVFTNLYSDSTPITGYEWRSAVTFIPDPNHDWGKEKAINKLLTRDNDGQR